MNTIKLKPIGNRIVVQPVEERELKYGPIVIPDAAKQPSQEAIVVALGTGEIDDDGKRVPFDMKIGDRILMAKYGGAEIKSNGVTYKLLSASEVLAIIGE